MKFKNDNHRKAVFANLFNKERGRSRVNPLNVKNFEINSTLMNKNKLQKFKTEQVRFSDIKKIKGLKAHCNMCKRKGLSMTKGRCKECIEETTKFQSKISSVDFDKLKKSTKAFFGIMFFLIDHHLEFVEDEIEEIKRDPMGERRKRRLIYLEDHRKKAKERYIFLKKHKKLINESKLDSRVFKSKLVNFIRLIDGDRKFSSEVGWFLSNSPDYFEVTEVIRETLGQYDQSLNMSWRPNY